MAKQNTPYFSNAQIGEFLQNVATVYEIKNKNRFRITSYQNAADIAYNYPKSIYQLWQEDKNNLDTIPGIGKSILAKLDYYFTHHDLHPHLKRNFKSIHPAVFALTKVNGIGPKTAYKLTSHLKFPRLNQIKILEKLIRYCQQKKLQNIEDFGEKSEELILINTKNYLGRQNRLTLKQATLIANEIITYLQESFPQTDFVPLGSLRRQNPTVGDIDIAAKSNQTQEIIDHFASYPKSIQTINYGHKKASIKLDHDLRVDLMVQSPENFGSLLIHFTGSKAHNIELRKYALHLGFSISEHGITDLRTKKIHKFNNETSFYNFLGLAYIDPTARTGENEISQAKLEFSQSISK